MPPSGPLPSAKLPTVTEVQSPLQTSRNVICDMNRTLCELLESLQNAKPVGDPSSVTAILPVDAVTCDNESLGEYIIAIREAVHRTEPVMKNKKRKTVNRVQQETLNEEISTHLRSLGQAMAILTLHMDEINDLLRSLRQKELILLQYYENLDEAIEDGETETTHRNTLFHRRNRLMRREAPQQRYTSRRELLETRLEQFQRVHAELKAKESDLAPSNMDDSFGGFGRNASMSGCLDEEKFVDDAFDVAQGKKNSPEVQLLLRALRPLWRRVQATRIEPPLPSRMIESWLRKDLILPFSARVLALKMDEAGNAGDRFVEWYVNTILDPLAMAQLVELMPREYLVTTTARLASACDMCLKLRQSQALPDISHVVLQAVAEGRSDALASLVLSQSVSFLRALDDEEQTAVIFFAALLTGQIEVLRRIISVGFYCTKALIVWLFLNPNDADPYYKEFVTQTLANVNRYLVTERGSLDLEVSEITHGDISDNLTQEQHFTASGATPSFFGGLVESLRRFLCNRAALKSERARVSVRPMKEDVLTDAQSNDPPIFTPTPPTKTEKTSALSFSNVLLTRRLDRLLLSRAQCAVLPGVSTFRMRRIDPWGYVPLEGTTEYLLLLGDTSTINAHTVRMPPEYALGWEDIPVERKTGRGSSARSNEFRDVKKSIPPKASADKSNLRNQRNEGIDRTFYYEAHISIPFLLADVPVTSESFETILSIDEKCCALQETSVYVGWCSEEMVPSADGKTVGPPLGSDAHSIGISFDIVYRGRLRDGGERVIIRPMRHAKGQSTPVFIKDEPQHEELDSTFMSTKKDALLELRIDSSTLGGKSGSDVFGNRRGTQFSQSLNASTAPLQLSVKRDRVIPKAHLMDDEGGSSPDTSPFAELPRLMGSGADICQTTSVFDDLSLYGSLLLVVGCKVNLRTHCASFVVNDKELCDVFTLLPSPNALRPAVTLRASEKTATALQRNNPTESAVVRFAFSAERLIDKSYNKSSNSLSFINSRSRSSLCSALVDKPRNIRRPETSEIPYIDNSHPYLFDDVMMQCAFLRVFTQAESSLEGGMDEILSGADAIALGKSVVGVTACRVRALLNTPTSLDSLLFFPPVYVRRRTDDVDKGTIGVTIIPADASLAPICVALSLRHRIAAYHIAVNPLTDFQSTDEMNMRQRRMAILAAASLGYEEVLYVLLERMPIFEVLALFTIKKTEEQPTSVISPIRDIGGGTFVKCNANISFMKQFYRSVTLIHRVEYTPLHCALLEGHERCVHLLLYYLEKNLLDEHKRHAVNVLTRSGETALVMACKGGKSSVAKRLLAMGAYPSSFDRVSRSNCLELACASGSEEIAETLLETSDYKILAAVNHVGNASPLCWCALNNIGSLIKRLLQNGANPNIALEGLTPLILAVTFGSEAAALQLLEWCEPIVSDLQTPSESLSCKANEAIVESGEVSVQMLGSLAIPIPSKQTFASICVNAIDPRSQCTALHIACELGQLEVMRALMEKGASLNLQNKSTFATPLQMAIMNGHEDLALELLEYAKDRLRRGFNALDIAIIDKNGNTALHLASAEGMLPVIEYIMSQFSDDEITRLCNLRKFTKRPNSVSVTASNRSGRTPLLMAIYAHMEEAAQLIVSLMPDVLSNPGGAVIEGTCMALLASEAEGLDNVTLFLLSHPLYAAADAFRENFFARYNAQRMRLDQQEDLSEHLTPPAEQSEREAFPRDALTRRSIMRPHSRPSPRHRRKTDLRGGLMRRASISLATSHHEGSIPVIKQNANVAASRNRALHQPHTAFRVARRRRSSFLQMLLAKCGNVPSTRKAIHCLLRGFAVEELCAMLDVIITETSRASQSRGAMQYAELIIGFLTDHSGIYITSSDALSFTKKMYTIQILAEAVSSTELAAAKKKLNETPPFCSELFTIVRTRGHQDTCIDDMRHLIEQRGKSGASLTKDLTSPFGFTLLQLTASLELSEVTEFLLNECDMEALYVSPSCEEIRKPFLSSKLTDDTGLTTAKWLLTPFRLALLSRNRDILEVFLPETFTDEVAEELMEFRESPIGDPFQQTALQEVLRQPLDGVPEATAMATLDMARHLLRQGAAVHSNADAEGNDAWMLAVRSSPGTGRLLELFFDENVEMDEESEEEKEFNFYEEEKGETDSDKVMQEKNILQKDKQRQSFSESLDNASEIQASDSLVSGLHDGLPRFVRDTHALYPFATLNRQCGLFETNRKAYNAQILFLCVDHNPRHLIVLLERYSNVLSPSAVHPRTGETILMYILSKAVHFYESAEDTTCSTNAGGHGRIVSSDTELKTISRIASALEDTISSPNENDYEDEGIPYRDPLTIPSVVTLINVVEQMLQKFYISNLHHRREDGETALSLAARLGNTSIVSLIVRPVHRSANLLPPALSSTLGVGDDSESIQGAPDEINPDLEKSLLLVNCLSNLSTRLYYSENELETILAISRHISDVDTRLTFISIVFTNLHPILSLRVAGHFASDAKKILLRPEAANAFWCNVLYAQYTGRLDEVAMKPSQWNSLLIVLLPVAPAVALYLIKSSPMLAYVRMQNPSQEQSTLTTPVRLVAGKKNNWSEIVKRTEAYFRQLAIASANILAPNTSSQQPIPASQRQAFSSMAGLFNEIIELTVRFDNASLLVDLLTNNEPLKDHLKQVFCWLMENQHLDVIAFAAGSIDVVKLLAGMPVAAAYMSCDRYDRIDPNTGFPEDLRRYDASACDSMDSIPMGNRRRSFDKPANISSRTANAPQSSSFRGVLLLPDALMPSQSPGRRSRGVVGTPSSADSATAQEATKGEDEPLGETVMQYMEVLTAARERTQPAAVTWGVGAAARPVLLQKGAEKEANRLNVDSFHSTMVPSVGSRGRSTIQFSEGHSNSISPYVTSGKEKKGLSESPMLPSLKHRSSSLKLLKVASLPPIRTIGTPKRSATTLVDAIERGRLGGALSNVTAPTGPIRYFAHYLCDWALHSTLVLHAPKPSLRTIETILYLLDFRAPVTVSVIKIFFAASRPASYWASASGEQLTLNYTTRTHKDTLLHLLVQQDQLQLTQYFLATALFYFTRYQYDPPSVMPPKFLVMDFNLTSSSSRQTLESRHFGSSYGEKMKRNGQQHGEEEEEEEDSSYPAVFLRCMLKTNKYGLTPFDYARGPMVSLLMEYGCVPPSYRPNPGGFCRSVRLSHANSTPTWHTFQSVPRLLLVSKSLIKLRDDRGQSVPPTGPHTSGEAVTGSGDTRIPDATIARNQVVSQRLTRAAGLEELPTDDVSLLHLGLCSAKDELVLQKIATNRQKQLALLASGNVSDYTIPPIMPPDVPERSSPPSTMKAASSVGKMGLKRQRGSKPPSGRQPEKEPPTALGLLHVLRDRGFVTFPLVLPLSEVGDSGRQSGVSQNETAILISMTPMMLAQCAGVVKREESSAHSAPHKKSTTSSIPPRFSISEKGSSSAELLESWIATRRVKTSGKDPNMHLLVKSLNGGALGQNIRALSLTSAPSYDPKR